MTFLDRTEYARQVGITPMSDYRFCYAADFELFHNLVDGTRTYQYAMRAHKPVRA
jgi:hypothetical protein